MVENEKVRKLKDDISYARSCLEGMMKELSSIQQDCPHIWGEVSCKRIHEENVLVTELSSFPPQYPDPRNEWSRECQLCGKIEQTREFWKETIYHPKFE